MTRDGFSPAEREAMRARAEELRAAKGGRKKAADTTMGKGVEARVRELVVRDVG